MKKIFSEYKHLLAVTVFFSMCTSIGMVLVSIILQQVIDVSMDGNIKGFVRILWYSLIYIITLGIVSFLYNYYSKKLVMKVTQNLRDRVFKGIIKKIM